MTVLDKGHLYQLATLDAQGVPEVLRFVKRKGPGYPGNTSHYGGTTLQEVLRACIDRLQYLNTQIAHPCNPASIEHLRSVIYGLEVRAAERHGRVWIPPAGLIEHATICPGCLHLGCTDSRHKPREITLSFR